MTVQAESLEGTGLTPLEFAVLAYVTKNGGEPDIDQTGLSQRLGIDRNSTSLLVERLASKGLLDRRENGEDRRARLLRLTRRGEKVFERTFPGSFADQLRILTSLKVAERELFLDLLVRVIDSNLALARPGAGRRKRGSLRTSSAET
jgi:DNA-binding MarR family transcriptional regulator